MASAALLWGKVSKAPINVTQLAYNAQMATSGHFSLRIVTWNIHKGVRGVGLRKRLEIHNMQAAVAGLNADVICLQEVRRINTREAAHFTQWPELPQADFLAPSGYEAVYRTNAFTKHGEHGNALLSRYPVASHAHEDMSDHRFEQRGLLHATLHVHGKDVHVIVVHLGLIASSRQRQLAQLSKYIERDIPKKDALIVAGDFNSPIAPVRWAQAALGENKSTIRRPLLHALKGHATFPSRLPMVQLDHVFVRHAKIITSYVPQGKEWHRMSDHLPLVVEVEL
jgi:endonuclease/exonuclease/phosphatase family metal-dependent hydrolase